MNNKTKVKRVPKRGHYDKDTIYRILDNNFYCHVGFVHDGYPVVIPTAYGRKDDILYLHGSMASRMMKNLAGGIDICITVSKVNGLVLAKSAFHHSMNYESVVIFGKAVLVEGDAEKMKASEILTNHILAGRWKEIRHPNAKELKGTMMLKVPITEASAKIRTGGPKDDATDESLPVWAGTIPFHVTMQQPEFVSTDVEIPDSVVHLLKQE